MPRRAAKTDANQTEIIAAYRKKGASVVSLAAVGISGVPDLLVGYGGKNYLVEVKPGDAKDKRQRELRANQKDWHKKWKGEAFLARDIEEALDVLRDRLVYDCDACGKKHSLTSKWCADCRQIFRNDRVQMHAAVLFARREAEQEKPVKPASIAVRFGLPLHDYTVEELTFPGLASRLLEADLLHGEEKTQWVDAVEAARLETGIAARPNTRKTKL